MELTELIQAIKRKGVQMNYIACALGVRPQTFSAKIHGRTKFDVEEALKVMDILGEPKTGKNFERLFLPKKMKGSV